MDVKTLAYTRLYIPLKAMQIRLKRHIRVVFVVSELGCWKTEPLLRAMLAHPRFEPSVAVVPIGGAEQAVPDVEKYMAAHGYPFRSVPVSETIAAHFPGTDIIFYQQPYGEVLAEKHRIRYNRTSLFCYAQYGMFTTMTPVIYQHALFALAWQVYFLNASDLEDYCSMPGLRHGNEVVTGLPAADAYTEPAEDTWKQFPVRKKRIIWAPHHTLPDEDGWLHNSNFLRYAGFMLALADRYSDRVQFAFKPHPMLRAKLEKRWGKERTDAYYAEWAQRENTQLSEGSYTGLFMHSDAMIHDSNAFTVEYFFTRRPVMFCENGADHAAMLPRFAREAYGLHEKAYGEEDIERFVRQVADGKDEHRAEREAFYEKYLRPQGGGTASEAVISRILGK